jgi:hypothetical protein
MVDPRYRYDPINGISGPTGEYCLSDEVGQNGDGPCLVAVSTETPFVMADVVKEMNELWDQIVELEAEVKFHEDKFTRNNNLFHTYMRAYMRLDEDEEESHGDR